MAARGDHDEHANAWRTCRFEKCPDCRAYTAVGLDDVGLTRRIDPRPLTEHGELQARTDERQTFTLRARGGGDHRLELSFPRGYNDITSRPAPTDLDMQNEAHGGSLDYDVVAGHACGLNPDRYQHTASVHDRRHHQLDNANPPF